MMQPRVVSGVTALDCSTVQLADNPAGAFYKAHVRGVLYSISSTMAQLCNGLQQPQLMMSRRVRCM